MHMEFWGKAQPALGGGASSHPLVAHSLDVAAVAAILEQTAGLGIEKNTLCFLVAIHDIGKFSRPFQAKVPLLWPTILGELSGNPPPSGPRHDAVGVSLLQDAMPELFDALFAGWRLSQRRLLFAALAGHHGRPPPDARLSSAIVCNGCLEAARGFVQALFALFDPLPLARPVDSKVLPRLAWKLAGLTTLADWVGSRQVWFPYVEADEVGDLAGYWRDHALPQAEMAVREAGLAPVVPSPWRGLRGLFPTIKQLSPVQAWSEQVTLPEGPVLAVIEDLTGSGKTEAAVTLAHRLIAGGRADGLFVALPTMATANAMFDRLSNAYRGLFDARANPSLALAHGRAGIDPRFAAAIAAGTAASAERSPHDPADDPAEAQCVAWLAEDRRRALLAQVGVGTIDQALLGALPVRHAPLRLHGLRSKVLVIDEAHAFDPYMQREMVALLRFHAALGGSAILLSATLPKALRQTLVDAFRDGLGAPVAGLAETGYPLATLVGAATVTETPCAVRTGLARRVVVTRLEGAEAAAGRIAAAAHSGAAAAWVRNTVDDAIAAAALLRAQGIEVLLFHARFAMVDRLRIEAEVMRRFGPAPSSDRPGVLVATQVIEQSLDLDFDLLCTDLAPADLLIQRAGRLWRHHRTARPIDGPELLVISPAPVEDPGPSWLRSVLPGTAAVYRDPALLWRGARAVFGSGAIVTPEDMRPLIEAAAEGEIPDGLAQAASAAEGKRLGQQGVAEQNTLDVWKGYVASQGLWDTDLRTPTRLEDQPQVTMRLAVLRDGQVVPYADDPDLQRAWALSEVRIAAHRAATCPPPAGLVAAVEAARAKWGRWERESDLVHCAVLNNTGRAMSIDVVDGGGQATTILYDPLIGLYRGEYLVGSLNRASLGDKKDEALMPPAIHIS